MKGILVGLCAALVTAATFTVSVGAQARSFEVASVKPSNPNPTGPLGAIPLVLPALGRLSAQNVTLRLLVVAAYQKQPYEVVGGPPWQALIDGSKYVDPRLAEIFDEVAPDVIVEDNVVAFPAINASGRPWVRIVSCNPMEMKDPLIAPS